MGQTKTKIGSNMASSEKDKPCGEGGKSRREKSGGGCDRHKVADANQAYGARSWIVRSSDSKKRTATGRTKKPETGCPNEDGCDGYVALAPRVAVVKRRD